MHQTPAAARSLRELIAFCAWTLGLTLLVCWGPLAVLQIPGASAAGGQSGPGWALALFLLGGFMPSLVGVALTAKTEGRAGLRRLWRRTVALGFSGRWYLAMLLISAAVGGARLLTHWTAGSGLRFAVPLGKLFADPTFWVGITLSAVMFGALSEEFGWRGYAQERILACFRPLTGSLLLGAVWAVWHLPLFFIPGTSQSAAGQPVLRFSLYAVFVISLTVIMTWLYTRTGRSLGAAVLMHTLINLVGTLVAVTTESGLADDVAQATACLAAAVAVVLMAGPQLGANTETRHEAAA